MNLLRLINEFCLGALVALIVLSVAQGLWTAVAGGLLALAFNLAVYYYERTRED